jgi:hypothetical protein
LALVAKVCLTHHFNTNITSFCIVA